ncbi:ABC transporter permease [Occallatibacter riparius]|uniref:ABC transporter permease n=1 Tax=Occallatibacter riparius TaxID=1002689 RepID=A0A9J7BVI0_9BACT|nr:ABC transporter permease [Occallatibacter riparius]UWZ86695.1 ABC transporter permease [Occallatibacter riparius]
MRWLSRLGVQFRMLFSRNRAHRELDAELRDHLDRQIAENTARGMSDESARAAALRTFGNPALLRDQAHDTWNWAAAESLLHDVRIGCRTLLRTPGFTVIAILVMALGIGANVALFTIVRGVLLKPLPYSDPERLVTLYERSASEGLGMFNPVAAGSFSEWQRAATGVEQMALVSPFQNYNVSAEGGKLPERIDAGFCSWNLFSLLGVQPALGRTFAEADDEHSAQSTVMLSDAFWRRRYAGDPAIVGKTIWLDAKPYTVVGVLPASFLFNSAFGGNTVQVWTPVGHEFPEALLKAYDDHEGIVMARLKPGVTLQSVLAQLGAVQAQIKKEHAAGGVNGAVNGRSMLDDAVHDYKTPLYALLAATGCVLLIACMNVASLLIARTAARGKEMAIRTALGGGRMRLMRERLTESLLISVMAGAVGIGISWAALQLLVKMRPDMNRVESIRIDGGVALFTIAAIASCALFAGLISALGADGKRLLSALQESSRANRGSHQRATLRRVLLVLEVSLTVVLLAGAGLLLKSYQRLRTTDLGIPINNALRLHVSLPESRYKEEVQQVAFFEQLIAGVRALPGVEAAGLVSTAPGQGWGGDSLADTLEQPRRQEDLLDIHRRAADPGYFAAAQIPLLRGRIFTSDERLSRSDVALISLSTAQQLFPGQDPIGKHLHFGYNKDVYEIIGVVGDVRWDIHEPPKPTMYMPLYGHDWTGATIFVRGRNVESLAMPIENVVGRLDRDLPVSNVMTFRESIAKSTIDSQFDSLLILSFAVIALILAGAGLYGVLAYLVTQRTGEIGIRMALGAPRKQVMRLMLLDGLRPALIGLVLGLAGSAATGRLIASMLFDTKPLDAGIYTAVAATLLVVAGIACMLPAWRASRIDPMQALRTE